METCGDYRRQSRMFARFERNGMSERISIQKHVNTYYYQVGEQNKVCAYSEKTC